MLYWHLFLETAAFILSIVGLVAIILSKQQGGYKHMYSVHAWCGVVVMVFFSAQVSSEEVGYLMFVW